jgi:type IV pilus assembly protein PilE
MQKSQQKGFSLIELMIVVAIIGLLSAIALPAYRDYVLQSTITDATSVLSARRVLMEQYFQDNRTYVGADTPATPGLCDAGTSKSYDFSCSVAPGATVYTLMATGKSNAAGFSFTLDQDNAKTSSGPSGWSSGANCWITKKSGC